ncbi:MAG: type 1 glutamine amidotransferase domain-containing protein [Reichenbachiella sp.]
MFKKHPVLKWSLLSFLILITSIITFGVWFVSLIPSEDVRSHLPATQPEDLPYLSNAPAPTRGKVLAIVSSHAIMGSSGKKTGYELTELARPYYVFKANGFEVDIASPKGGSPPVVIDWDDMGAFDFAFLNDSMAQKKSLQTIPLLDVIAQDYEAVYFAGGKGAMFDFPNNAEIQTIIRDLTTRDKVVGAVCHGPAALVNVTLEDGSPFVANKEISGFTNTEEFFLIPDARSIFPFLLQDKLIQQGAEFNEGLMYLKNVVRDGNLITGQNPWSTWAFAEIMVEQMGYLPQERQHTAEENTVDILSTYKTKGYNHAVKQMNRMTIEQKPIDPMLLGMHFIVSVMGYEPGEAVGILRLLVYFNKASDN